MGADTTILTDKEGRKPETGANARLHTRIPVAGIQDAERLQAKAPVTGTPGLDYLQMKTSVAGTPGLDDLQMKTPVQLVALDLDRTTLNHEGHLSECNRQAILDAVAKGVHVCIASGRGFDSLPEEVTSIPGVEYAITSNGAAVYRIRGKELLRSYLLTPESVDTILKVTQDEPVAYEAFIRGKAFASREYVDNPVKFGATPQAVAYVQRTRTLKEDIVSFIRENRNNLDCMDVVVPGEALHQELWKRIQRATPDVYVTSSVRQLLEISYKDAGKHAGLRFLAEYLRIPREATVAFGDAENDRDMLEYAGIGIAVGNAAPQLKEIADYVTLSHDEDGVAWAFRNILNL